MKRKVIAWIIEVRIFIGYSLNSTKHLKNFKLKLYLSILSNVPKIRFRITTYHWKNKIVRPCLVKSLCIRWFYPLFGRLLFIVLGVHIAAAAIKLLNLEKYYFNEILLFHSLLLIEIFNSVIFFRDCHCNNSSSSPDNRLYKPSFTEFGTATTGLGSCRLLLSLW